MFFTDENNEIFIKSQAIINIIQKLFMKVFGRGAFRRNFFSKKVSPLKDKNTPTLVGVFSF